jgi:hypothetical protein
LDGAQFLKNAPGKTVRIDTGEFAFVPDGLPPDWVMPLEVWPLLSEAKQQLGILEGAGRTIPNPGLFLRPVQDREAI